MAAQLGRERAGAQQARRRVAGRLVAHAPVKFEHASSSAQAGQQLAVADRQRQDVVGSSFEGFAQLAFVQFVEHQEFEQSAGRTTLTQQATQCPAVADREFRIN